MNLTEIDELEVRQRRLRERFVSGQITENEYYNMQDFNYSATGPLIQSGHFHKMLGSKGVKDYFTAANFFSNSTAQFLTNRLHEEHAKGTSIDFMDQVEQKIAENKQRFANVKADL